jgi:phosphatidylserine/phosphatidylglycerophosphate/cardiolipin synthase-like enzyme
MNRYIFCLFILPLFSQSALADPVTFQDAFSPHQGPTALVVKTIQEAKKTIDVAAYSFTSDPIAEALVAAHDRGVDVKVVSDKTRENDDIVDYLVSHGVPVRINYHYRIMHDKFMIIDEKTLELGSFNYTKSAEEHNAENVLVIHNAESTIKDYITQWKKLWGEGEKP